MSSGFSNHECWNNREKALVKPIFALNRVEHSARRKSPHLLEGLPNRCETRVIGRGAWDVVKSNH